MAEVEDRQNNDLTEQRDIKTVLPVLLQRGETLGYLLLHNICHIIKMDTIFKSFCSLIMFFFFTFLPGAKETLQQDKINNMV